VRALGYTHMQGRLFSAVLPAGEIRLMLGPADAVDEVASAVF